MFFHIKNYVEFFKNLLMVMLTVRSPYKTNPTPKKIQIEVMF